MEKQKKKRTFTWVGYRWQEAMELFTETNTVTDEREVLRLYSTTAIVAERLAMFSINRAWAKAKEKAL